MPTRTFASNKSSLFADSGSTELGGGADDHLPVGGPWSGYYFRSAIQFALDFSTMKTITSAVLRLRTTTQSHVGFSSDPDIIVSRCTGSWTANSAAESWSTSPTVWPGPSTTSTGQVTKDIPTSESTDVDIDITAIVKAWAPSSVAGGGGAANYGVRLAYAASGDVTEFYSYRHGTASVRPEIIVTYTVDSPPTATATGPTGVQTTLRPTITGTGSDPDGDAITRYGVEVKSGSTVVHSFTSSTGGPTLSYVPTSDLPAGALTVAVRAEAAGVWSAWSAALAFTIDRAPSTATPTAPTGNVSGTRRPNIVFTASDPDGDAIEVWDTEVYATSGGVPTGSPVYSKTSQTGGISGYTVTHTPTADLPPGALQVRARVRTRGVWSGWSGYKAFTIVTANPSISWVWPPTPGGPLLFFTPHPAPGTGFHTATARVQAEATAPAGYTLSTFTRKIDRIDGPGAPYTVLNSSDPGAPGKATYLTSVPFAISQLAASAGWRGLSALLEITMTATSSNGGSTTEVRRARVSFLEWQGFLYLGDNVTALTIREELPPAGSNAPPVDIRGTWYRAQSSKTAPAGAAPWRDKSAIDTVRAELPAQNAYLGIYIRSSAQSDDVELLDGGGSFEPGFETSWRPIGPHATSIAFTGAPDGARVMRITGNGGGWPSVTSLDIPVIPGGTYVLSGYAKRFSGTLNAYARIDLFGPGGSRPYNAQTVWTSSASFVYASTAFVVPSDGLWTYGRVLFFINGSPAPASDVWDFDGITFVGPRPADSGFDKVVIDWTSAG